MLRYHFFCDLICALVDGLHMVIPEFLKFYVTLVLSEKFPFCTNTHLYISLACPLIPLGLHLGILVRKSIRTPKVDFDLFI